MVHSNESDLNLILKIWLDFSFINFWKSHHLIYDPQANGEKLTWEKRIVTSKSNFDSIVSLGK